MSLLLLVICIGIAAFLSAATGRRAERCVPVAVCGMILLLYLFGLVGCLAAGVFAVLAAGVLCIAAFVYWWRKKDRDALRRVATPGMAAFIVAGILLSVIVRRQVFAEWDEFSHWGLAVKSLMLTNAFHGAQGACTVFSQYPPALSLLPYLAAKLAGGFAERTVYFAYGVFTLSLLLPILSKTEWKRPLSALLLALFCGVLPLVFFPRHYISVYADATLGLLSGYLLLAYFTEEHRDGFFYAAFFAGMAVLILAKPTGIVFALLVTAIAGMDRIAGIRAGERADRRTRHIALGSAAACALLGLSWLVYVLATGAASDPVIVAAISPGGTVHLGVPDYLRDVVFSFLIRFVRPVGAGAISMSPLMWLCAFGALALLVSRLQKGEREQARAFRYGACVAAGFLVYASLLLVSYVFAFSAYDAQLLSSFDRYIGTYALGALMFFFGAFALSPAPNGASRAALLLAALLVAVLPLEETVTVMSRPGERIKMRASYEKSEAFSETLDAEHDKICVISQGKDALDQFIIRYNAAPVPVTFAYSWTLGESKSVYDEWSMQVASADWLAEAVRQGCTHVYLYSIEGTFLSEYASVFGGEIAADTLYRIETDAAGKTMLMPNS